MMNQDIVDPGILDDSHITTMIKEHVIDSPRIDTHMANDREDSQLVSMIEKISQQSPPPLNQPEVLRSK